MDHDTTIAEIVYEAPSYDDAIKRLTELGQLRDGTLYVTRSQYQAIMAVETAQPIPLFGPSPPRATGPSVQVVVVDDPLTGQGKCALCHEPGQHVDGLFIHQFSGQPECTYRAYL